MNNKPIIIDTDPGHDDALAIMLLVKFGRVDIKAITTVAGNTDIQKTTNNARYILDLVGSNVPIYSGADKPLHKGVIRANVHGKTGLAGAKVIKTEKLNKLAVSKIIDIVDKNPSKTTIITLGPLTNIAQVLKADPAISQKIAQIVIMGGAIDVPGNKSRVAEFNIFCDPDAAEIVFNANVYKILVPLDVCNDIPLFLSDFKKIKGSLRNPILDMMKEFISGIAKFENFRGALVYDALAAYYLINPTAFTLKRMDIRVETKGNYTNGMTVADKRSWGAKLENVQLVTKIERNKFVKDFVNILSS